MGTSEYRQLHIDAAWDAGFDDAKVLGMDGPTPEDFYTEAEHDAYERGWKAGQRLLAAEDGYTS